MKGQVNKFLNEIKENRPIIYLVCAVIGFTATAVATHVAAQKSVDEIKNAPTKKEKAKVIAKHYALPATLWAGSVCFTIAGGKEFTQKTAAIASALSVTDTAYKTYKDKVKEIVGEEKASEIKEAAHKERLKETPIPQNMLGSSTVSLIFDPYSGRYFDIMPDEIREACLTLSERIKMEDYLTLNDFYDEIGKQTTKCGECIGWHVEKLDRYMIEAKFTDYTVDGIPNVKVLEFVHEPDTGYRWGL